jgi:hypothetical protein
MAAEAGERTATAATDSLELARAEQRQTRFLALEAVKTRIDASMPRITVTTDPTVMWPPLVPSDFGAQQPVPVAAEPYRRPRDDGKPLMVRVGMSIKNDGPKAVRVTFSQELFKGAGVDRKGLKEAVLEPGLRVSDLYFEFSRNVGEWADIYEERDRTRAGGPEYLFYVMYIDPADNGAIDYFNVVVQGTILRPVRNEHGAWVLINDPAQPRDPSGEGIGAIGAVVQPTKRRYFFSRTANQELPDVALEDQ